MTKNSDFFEKKRVWSKIKDEVLRNYMPVYTAKLNKKGKPILLVDAFAGEGIFEDGSEGSPIIMCKAAEKFAPMKYTAIFINKKEKHHHKLTSLIANFGWNRSAKTLLGDSRAFLQKLPSDYRDYSKFIYLDPFGIVGCEFSLIETLLKEPDTEIMINISMPIVHRLASRKKMKDSATTNKITKTFHDLLDRTFGGNYWQEIMFNPSLNPEERERKLIEAYCAQLKRYLPFVGSCPVRETSTQRVKYFMVFGSSHPDAMLKLNDIMFNAYFSNLHVAETRGTLWESLTWQDMRNTIDIKSVVLNTVSKHLGETRANVWLIIVQSHFMRFSKSEYLKAVKELDAESKIKVTDRPSKNKYNDNSKLYLNDDPQTSEQLEMF